MNTTAVEQQAASPETQTSMTQAQSYYAELDRKYSKIIKPFLEEFSRAREAVVEEAGLGAFFQDEDGTVYRTGERKGQWVEFARHEIQRTRRPGEQKGSLSLAAAREAGFTVEGER